MVVGLRTRPRRLLNFFIFPTIVMIKVVFLLLFTLTFPHHSCLRR